MLDFTEEMTPATVSELARKVAENASRAAQPIYPAGGRTALACGRPSRTPGILLSTTELTKVIDYPARDMTITVEAGIRLTELAAVLATEGQRLPVDVPQGHRATLGGAVACNASGARRFGLGTLRDYVIGIAAVDASGKSFKAGGRVVKNVAGYDLCKMLVGSQGTLAIITQLTLKLKPAPQASRLLWCAFDHLDSIDQALERLGSSGARPVALELLNPAAAASVALEAAQDLPTHRPVLCLGVEGTDHETTWQIDTLRNELQPYAPHSMTVVAPSEAEAVWGALTEFQVASDDPLTFKASLLPSRTVEFVRLANEAGCSIQAHVGNGIVRGHLPDSVTSSDTARTTLDPLRNLAERCGGSLVIEHCDKGWKAALSVLGAPVEPAWQWMRKLKQQLDPRGLLNPHRLFESL
ncbi:MAG: FAD-binding oxidoreductase [Planctomycetales bacterium]